MHRARLSTPLPLLLAAVALAACYGAAPPRPTLIPLPPLEPGARITVTSEDTTEMEVVAKQSSTCPAGHLEGSPDCVVTHYTEREPVTRTHTTATYGDTAIDAAQFAVLTDPDRDASLERLADLSRRCAGASTPRWIGTGLTVGGLVLWGIAASTQERAFTYLGLAALGGGVGSYAYGYVGHGGNRCAEADALHERLEVAGGLGKATVEGAQRAAEMKALADQFNARAAAAARAR